MHNIGTTGFLVSNKYLLNNCCSLFFLIWNAPSLSPLALLPVVNQCLLLVSTSAQVQFHQKLPLLMTLSSEIDSSSGPRYSQLEPPISLIRLSALRELQAQKTKQNKTPEDAKQTNK